MTRAFHWRTLASRIARGAFLLGCNMATLLAQTPALHPQVGHPSANKNSHTGTATSRIQFENTSQTSKLKFVLKNSISPKRYTFETMAGGVAL
ncbi:MAG TPA: hypothetical protein VKM56_05515, partial [Verrucomicrobiae bacterium]|nr:hypothetical protein [Verrucomicrobiae bacterium]